MATRLFLPEKEVKSGSGKLGFDHTFFVECASGIMLNKIAGMRFVLALSIFSAISLGSSISSFPSTIAIRLLAGYTIYSFLLCLVMLRNNRLSKWIQRWSPWGDICWYTFLFVFGIETSSIFYFGFFFAILTSSLTFGFASGLRLTIGSIFLTTVVGYISLSMVNGFLWRHFLLQQGFLLVVGPMIAYWGGKELKLKRQLVLLKEINRLSNPRFGVDRTFGFVMKRLRTYFAADACVMITHDVATSNYVLRRTARLHPEPEASPEPISEELANRLMSLPKASGISFRSAWPFMSWTRRATCYEYDLMTGNRQPLSCENVTAVAGCLDATSLISVPIRQNYHLIGRIYLTSSRRWSVLANYDVDFLHQVVEHVIPILENIRLVDRLASDAAESERQRIARDIHDSVVQPYIGLQMGLTAIRQKLQLGGLNIEDDIDLLFEMTGHGINDLRAYISGLKVNGNGNGKQATTLEPAVRRFAEKFSEATGILVEVEFDHEKQLQVNDRLTAEVFQMIAEGLSNIRRHTQSACARIAIGYDSGKMQLEIENDLKTDSTVTFAPRSLAERAAALGGTMNVKQKPPGSTVVVIEIPL